MAADFDPSDRASWYFGALTRDGANEILNDRVDSGTFLVRDSKTMVGDYVLCVREDQKVSHYIVNRIAGDRFRIGDQDFPDIPSMLSFYKTHYLDTTSLIRPAERAEFRVIAKYDFDGRDPDDLPFRKDEILTVIKKDEEQWWTARNAQGAEGSIPVPYIEKYEGGNAVPELPSPSLDPVPVIDIQQQRPVRTLPAYAKVITPRIPNAYDKTALKLEVGDIIVVTSTPVNGQWEGESKGKKGHFPFRHVKFIDQDEATGRSVMPVGLEPTLHGVKLAPDISYLNTYQYPEHNEKILELRPPEELKIFRFVHQGYKYAKPNCSYTHRSGNAFLHDITRASLRNFRRNGVLSTTAKSAPASFREEFLTRNNLASHDMRPLGPQRNLPIDQSGEKIRFGLAFKSDTQPMTFKNNY